MHVQGQQYSCEQGGHSPQVPSRTLRHAEQRWISNDDWQTQKAVPVPGKKLTQLQLPLLL